MAETIGPRAVILLFSEMIQSGEVVIGNKGADYVSLHVKQHDREGWARAEIVVRCDGWVGTMRGSFMKGELARFAEGIRQLHRDLTGIAELNPLEPNITLTLKGDGKGHITVDGVARNDFASRTELAFEFTIDQTYLKGIADSLCAVDAK